MDIRVVVDIVNTMQKKEASRKRTQKAVSKKAASSSHKKYKNYKESDGKSVQDARTSDMFTGAATNVVLNSYEYKSERIPITVTISKKPGEFVPTYDLQISAISKTTELILERVRLELIRRVSLGTEDIGDIKKTDLVEDKFNQLIDILIEKYFPDKDGIEIIYSMWGGYRTGIDPASLFAKKHGLKITDIHTSGHASHADLKKLVDAIEPKWLIPIHTLDPRGFKNIYDKVFYCKDGENYTI